MFQYFCGSSRTVTVDQAVLFSPVNEGRTSSIMSGIPTTCPSLTFARAPNGWLYMANGLQPMRRWNGSRFESVEAGVAAPVNAPTLAIGGTGTLFGTYNVYQRFIDEDGNPSNLSPVSNTVSVDENVPVGTFTVANLDAPTDLKVTVRQILRNTNGQQLTYYVELETTDIASTSFDLTMDDDTLSQQAAVPFFDDKGHDIVNRFAIPPNDRPIVVSFLGRLFAMGDVSYAGGHAELTNGSTAIQGIGTAWTVAMEGRFFYITGQPEPYVIDTVDPDAQTLVLTTAYAGGTDPFAQYQIRSDPATRNRVFFSEPGQFDGWPPFNAFDLDENGDDIVGGMPAESFLFILQRRHVWRETYLNGPTVDGAVFLQLRRGCVNQRCWVQVDDMNYLLDEEGIYRFSGGEAEPISNDIQDLFWRDDPPDGIRINWSAQCHFHAALHKDDSTIRWYVALSGQHLPRHALCFNYRSEQWWIEEYPFAIGASCVSEGPTPTVYLVGPAKRVFRANMGTLDAATANSGTLHGTVTSATRTTLTDSTASFPDVAGTPVAIVDGKGRDQRNLIISNTATALTLKYPWRISLDDTSVYQIGGVNWMWRGGWYRWVTEESSNPRRVEMVFSQANALMELEIFQDRQEEPTIFQVDWPPTRLESTGITTVKGDTQAIVDLSANSGYAHLRLDHGKVDYTQRADFISLQLSGFSSESLVKIYEVTLEGAEG